MMPIVLDIEFSGLDLIKCGIWQIGAIDLNTMEEFIDEARIDDEDKIVNIKGMIPVLESIGKTEKYLRNPNKQSQKGLLEKFFKWIKKRKLKSFLCQNPQFDFSFLRIKTMKYGLKIPFGPKCFDLHTIAQKKYYELYGKFLIRKDRSDMGLKNILNFCGLKDKRLAHNALEDCRLTAECFSRLMFGKNLFPKYKKFKIPEVLRK